VVVSSRASPARARYMLQDACGYRKVESSSTRAQHVLREVRIAVRHTHTRHAIPVVIVTQEMNCIFLRALNKRNWTCLCLCVETSSNDDEICESTTGLSATNHCRNILQWSRFQLRARTRVCLDMMSSRLHAHRAMCSMQSRHKRARCVYHTHSVDKRTVVRSNCISFQITSYIHAQKITHTHTPHSNTHTHTEYTFKHTHTHTYANTHKHTYTSTHSRARRDTTCIVPLCTHTHTSTHSKPHIYDTHTHTCSNTQHMHAHTHSTTATRQPHTSNTSEQHLPLTLPRGVYTHCMRAYDTTHARTHSSARSLDNLPRVQHTQFYRSAVSVAFTSHIWHRVCFSTRCDVVKMRSVAAAAVVNSANIKLVRNSQRGLVTDMWWVSRACAAATRETIAAWRHVCSRRCARAPKHRTRNTAQAEIYILKISENSARKPKHSSPKTHKPAQHRKYTQQHVKQQQTTR